MLGSKLHLHYRSLLAFPLRRVFRSPTMSQARENLPPPRSDPPSGTAIPLSGESNNAHSKSAGVFALKV